MPLHRPKENKKEKENKINIKSEKLRKYHTVTSQL